MCLALALCSRLAVETLYKRQFTLSTQLIKPNYLPSVFARPTGMYRPFIQVTCSKERKWHGVYDQSDH